MSCCSRNGKSTNWFETTMRKSWEIPLKIMGNPLFNGYIFTSGTTIELICGISGKKLQCLDLILCESCQSSFGRASESVLIHPNSSGSLIVRHSKPDHRMNPICCLLLLCEVQVTVISIAKVAKQQLNCKYASLRVYCSDPICSVPINELFNLFNFVQVK